MEMFWIATQICFGLLSVIFPILMLMFWGLRNSPVVSSLIVGALSFSIAIYPVLFIYTGGHQIALIAVSAILSIIGTVVVYKIYRIVSGNATINNDQYISA